MTLRVCAYKWNGCSPRWVCASRRRRPGSVHIDEGFDFLGWRIQRQQKKGGTKRYVYTYPSKKALLAVCDRVRALTKGSQHLSLSALLDRINPVLRGWANYFKHGVSKAIFSYLDTFAWRRVVGWLRHKHHRASWSWLRRHYLPRWRPTEGTATLFNPAKVTVSPLPLPGGPHPQPLGDEHGTSRRLTGGLTCGEPDAWEHARPVRRGGPGNRRTEKPALLLGSTPYEWLARQLDKAGVSYVRYDNALLRIANLDAASELVERFAHRAWPRLLDALARRVNPHLHTIANADFGGYYWVVDQAEIATDVMFRDRASLTAIMPDLVRHATLNLSSADILHFLGRKLHPCLAAEVLTDARRRPEGWRVKHRMARKWVKACDKVSVLRVETTINNPREFRVLARLHRRSRPARAAVDSHEQRRGQRVEVLPGGRQLQPSLPGGTRGRPPQRQGHRCHRRLVPAPNQPRALPRPLRPHEPIGPSALPRRPRRRSRGCRLPKLRFGPATVSTSTR